MRQRPRADTPPQDAISSERCLASATASSRSAPTLGPVGAVGPGWPSTPPRCRGCQRCDLPSAGLAALRIMLPAGAGLPDGDQQRSLSAHLTTVASSNTFRQVRPIRGPTRPVMALIGR